MDKEQIIAKLKMVHYTWYGLGALWLAAFIPTFSTLPQNGVPSYSYEVDRNGSALGILCCIAYLAGGFVLGKIHNRLVAKNVNASYSSEATGNGAVFKITAAKRHMGFWVIGLFGFFLMFAIAYMMRGYGAGTLFTLVFGGVLYLLGLQPKLWKQIPDQTVEVTSSQIIANGETIALQEVKSLFVGNFLPSKSEKYGEQNYQYVQQQQTVYANDPNPLATQTIAAAQQVGVATTQAGGAAIAEVANRYFYEMKARSFQIEAVRGGSNLVLAKGLDERTAYALLAEIEKAAAPARVAA